MKIINVLLCVVFLQNNATTSASVNTTSMPMTMSRMMMRVEMNMNKIAKPICLIHRSLERKLDILKGLAKDHVLEHNIDPIHNANLLELSYVRLFNAYIIYIPVIQIVSTYVTYKLLDIEKVKTLNIMYINFISKYSTTLGKYCLYCYDNKIATFAVLQITRVLNLCILSTAYVIQMQNQIVRNNERYDDDDSNNPKTHEEMRKDKIYKTFLCSPNILLCLPIFIYEDMRAIVIHRQVAYDHLVKPCINSIGKVVNAAKRLLV